MQNRVIFGEKLIINYQYRGYESKAGLKGIKKRIKKMKMHLILRSNVRPKMVSDNFYSPNVFPRLGKFANLVPNP